MSELYFPILNHSSKDRPREFSCYTEGQRAACVYGWLVLGEDFRGMDKKYLGLTDDSKGWQSMGICHYLGLKREHQGIYQGVPDNIVLDHVASLCEDAEYYIIYHYLKTHIETVSTISYTASMHQVMAEFSDDEIRSKDWLINTLLWHKDDNIQIDKQILTLPDTEYQYVHRGNIYRYGLSELEESIKGLYDYRCQICGNTTYHRGWNDFRTRKNSWRYLSSEIYYPKQIYNGGAAIKSNMLCTCPSCRSKFISGELRLKQDYDHIYCQNEVFGSKHEVNIKHFIDLGL